MQKVFDYLLFGNYVRLRNKTAYIAYIAVLSALAIVLDTSFSIGLGGEVKLTLYYIPLFLTGIYFGPLAAAAVGVVSKIAGDFLFMGYMPWTTNIVGAALMGVIMSLCVQLIKHPKLNARIAIGAFIVLITVTLGINTLAFTYELFSPYQNMTYWQILVFTVPPRILVQPLILAFNTVLTMLLVGTLNTYFKGVKK